jgi:hypothetical protein
MVDGNGRWKWMKIREDFLQMGDMSTDEVQMEEVIT